VPRKQEREACHISKEIFTKAECKNPKNPKLQATLTKKAPRILPASSVLTHPEKCGFGVQIASCGHNKNALTAIRTAFV
jgi:hypothetical protein